MSALCELSYPQQQFTSTAIVVALWMLIELIPGRWWSRGRTQATRAARFVGATTLVTLAMIYLRTHITRAPKPEMWVVFFAVLFGSAFMLSRREYLRRFVPRAGPDELGVVRFALGLILTYLVVRDDLVSTLLIPENMLRKHGMVWWLHAKLGSASWLLDIRNPVWLHVVEWTAIVSGFATMIGLFSRFAAPILVLSFTLFYHTLCSYSHFFHVGLVPLLILCVLLFFPIGASFSVDAVLRRRRNEPPIEAPPEVWAWGVYTAWLMYGLAYWAAGASKLAQPRFWNGETLRYFAVRDSDVLLKYDFDLAQQIVAWDLDGWVFWPAAIAVLIAEVGAIGVLFSDRARKCFPPIMVSFHLGVIFLQGIVFFDLILLPIAFIPASAYRKLGTKLGLGKFTAERPKPEFEVVVERHDRNLARLILVAVLPGLVATGWLFKRERFPLMTRWGMFEFPVRGQVIKSNRLYAVHEDGRRERTDLTDEIWALNNTRFRDTVGWPAPHSRAKNRKIGIERIQALVNSAGAEHNKDAAEGDRIVRYELEKVYWDMEKDRDDPDHGKPVGTMVFVVGDAQHPEIPALDRRIQREREKKKREKQAKRVKQTTVKAKLEPTPVKRATPTK